MQVVVTTSKQRTITAKRMALTVGAWTNEVLSYLGMQLSLEIWKVHWGHYYVDPAVLHRLPQWYKFCKLRPDSWDEGLYYGFPPEDSQPLVKASKLLLCAAAPYVLASGHVIHGYAGRYESCASAPHQSSFAHNIAKELHLKSFCTVAVAVNSGYVITQPWNVSSQLMHSNNMLVV